MVAELIKFTVIGVPQPGGSKRAFVYRGKHDGNTHAAVSDANPKAKDWKHTVACTALEALNGSRGTLLTGPLAVRVKFYRPRPQGHYRGNGELNKAGLRSPFPTTKPDATKLCRCAEDSLNKVICSDDSIIVDQHVRKLWGVPARTEIEIEEIVNTIGG